VRLSRASFPGEGFGKVRWRPQWDYGKSGPAPRWYANRQSNPGAASSLRTSFDYGRSRRGEPGRLAQWLPCTRRPLDPKPRADSPRAFAIAAKPPEKTAPRPESTNRT